MAVIEWTLHPRSFGLRLAPRRCRILAGNFCSCNRLLQLNGQLRLHRKLRSPSRSRPSAPIKSSQLQPLSNSDRCCAFSNVWLRIAYRMRRGVLRLCPYMTPGADRPCQRWPGAWGSRRRRLLPGEWGGSVLSMSPRQESFIFRGPQSRAGLNPQSWQGLLLHYPRRCPVGHVDQFPTRLR